MACSSCAGECSCGSLVDSLISTVDCIRSSINTSMGTRQWKVSTIKRTWSGSRRGEGTSTDVVTELFPRPRVTTPQGRALDPAGMDDEGEIELHEISLSYTEADLMGVAGGGLPTNVEFFYRLSDAYTQGIPDRHYTLGRKLPFPDREKEIAWIVTLHRTPGVD